MSDFFWIFGTIGAFGLLIAWFDWTSPTPPDWVVKFRMWLNRRKG